MSREIKFRVWDIENKSWHNPNILEVWDDSGKLEPYEYVRTGKLYPLYMPIDNWVIQEYIGLKDKNGREVYEGDIIRQTDGKFKDYVLEGVVEYNVPNTAFVLQDNNGKITGIGGPETYIEVIGNIFETSGYL